MLILYLEFFSDCDYFALVLFFFETKCVHELSIGGCRVWADLCLEVPRS